jgi:hypothetical protein
MLKISLVFQMIFLSASIYCQIEKVYGIKKDSLGNEKVLTTRYDMEGIKLYESIRVNDEVEYTYYFTRKGDTISGYGWQLDDMSVLHQLRHHIRNNFVVNDMTEITGRAYLYLILDFENKVYEIRPLNMKYTQAFEKELLRVIEKVEKDLIVICPADCKTAIVVPFPVPFPLPLEYYGF